MGLRDEPQMPEGLEQIARRLRDERASLEPLQLDVMKTRVMARARAPRQKGAMLRGRIVVSLLTLGLMAAGAGGVVAAGGGSSGGSQSASSQYQPAHCHTDQAGNVKGCNCPDHSFLTTDGSGNFVCQCPDGSSFNGNGNSCQCPDGQKLDNKTDTCVPKGGPPPNPCHDHCAAGTDNSQCHDHCFDSNDPMCHDHCTGNPAGCHDHCNSPTADAGIQAYAQADIRRRAVVRRLHGRSVVRTSRFRGALAT